MSDALCTTLEGNGTHEPAVTRTSIVVGQYGSANYSISTSASGVEFFSTLPQSLTDLTVNTSNAAYCLRLALNANPHILSNIVSLQIRTDTSECQVIIDHILHNRPTLKKLVIWSTKLTANTSTIFVDPTRFPSGLECLSLTRPMCISFPKSDTLLTTPYKFPPSITELSVSSKMSPKTLFLTLPPDLSNLSFDVFGSSHRTPSAKDAALLPQCLTTLTCSFDSHAGRCGFFSALPKSLTSLYSLDGCLSRRQFWCLPLATRLGPTPIALAMSESAGGTINFMDADIKVMEHGVECSYAIGEMGTLVGYAAMRRHPIPPSAIARFSSGLLPVEERTIPPKIDDELTRAWEDTERLIHCCSIVGARQPREGRLIHLPPSLKTVMIESPRDKPDMMYGLAFAKPSPLPYPRESPFDAPEWPTTLESFCTDFFLPPNLLATSAKLTSLSKLAFHVKSLDESLLVGLRDMTSLVDLDIVVFGPSDPLIAERFLQQLPPRLIRLRLSTAKSQIESVKLQAPCIQSLPRTLNRLVLGHFSFVGDIRSIRHLLPNYDFEDGDNDAESTPAQTQATTVDTNST